MWEFANAARNKKPPVSRIGFRRDIQDHGEKRERRLLTPLFVSLQLLALRFGKQQDRDNHHQIRGDPKYCDRLSESDSYREITDQRWEQRTNAAPEVVSESLA